MQPTGQSIQGLGIISFKLRCLCANCRLRCWKSTMKPFGTCWWKGRWTETRNRCIQSSTTQMEIRVFRTWHLWMSQAGRRSPTSCTVRPKAGSWSAPEDNLNMNVDNITIIALESVLMLNIVFSFDCRSVGKTAMNEQSSRSHCVFTLRISGTNEVKNFKVPKLQHFISSWPTLTN